MIEWGVFGHGDATAGMYLAYHQSTLGYYLGKDHRFWTAGYSGHSAYRGLAMAILLL